MKDHLSHKKLQNGGQKETNSLQENQTREIAYFCLVLFKARYLRMQHTLELAIWAFIPASWRIAARITLLQSFWCFK